MTLQEQRWQIIEHVEKVGGYNDRMVALEKELKPQVAPEAWPKVLDLIDLGVEELTAAVDVALRYEKPGVALTA